MADSKATKVISRDLAEQEVNEWLDFKRVKSKKRESNADAIENLIDGFCDGDLVMDQETKEITLKLSFPAGNLNEFKFKPRLKLSDTHTYLKNAKSGDLDARVLAYMCALTGLNSGIVKELDTEDYGLAQSIAIFFF